jgi:hypothetical protein
MDYTKDNYFLRWRVSLRQRRLDGSSFAFLIQNCADANVTRVARYNVRLCTVRQLQH